MTNKTVGFVGGGRIVRIFLEGWTRANALPAKIVGERPQRGDAGEIEGALPDDRKRRRATARRRRRKTSCFWRCIRR